MKTHQSTVNGGKTVVLDSLADAMKIGVAHCQSQQNEYNAQDPEHTYDVSYIDRDTEATCPKCQANVEGPKCEKCGTKAVHKDRKTGTQTAAEMSKHWTGTGKRFLMCMDAITRGTEKQKKYIAELAQRICNMAQIIEPSLTMKPGGFARGEEGFEASPEALASDDDRPFIRRSNRSEDMSETNTGGDAYRIIINTDVSWWGKPDDNAGVMGALVLCLQGYGPVEIWIQQGWIDKPSRPNDGVTLFKLDFNGAWDPTQLAFWCGHVWKDEVFSFVISRALQRHGSGTSTEPEIDCSLYMRSDWLTLHGISEPHFILQTPEEQHRLMAAWVSKTSMRMLGRPENN